ncbi:MAG: Sec-independent protein translocase subunit TatA [Nocardioidaceae bacterium]|nr:Sec-independent protein translocase subunit TatA [Nocardioidaceae bacterium]
MFSQIGMPQGAEWLIILAIVVLVFGAAKLPDLARGTGQALRIFKAETKGLKDEDKKDAKTERPEPTPPEQLNASNDDATNDVAEGEIVEEPHEKNA